MDWELAIDRNREALLRLLAALFAMAGVTPGAVVANLPRRIRCMVLGLLRPIEAATLRLIIMAARDVVVSLHPASPFPAGGVPRGKGERAPSFPLFDRRKRVGFQEQRTAPGPGPRISFFDGSDPVVAVPTPPSPDDPVDAQRLCRRLLALHTALSDLTKQAKRFARRQARHERERQQGSFKRSPLRPGRPPGYRERPRRGLGHEIGEILSDCDVLARQTLEPPI